MWEVSTISMWWSTQWFMVLSDYCLYTFRNFFHAFLSTSLAYAQSSSLWDHLGYIHNNGWQWYNNEETGLFLNFSASIWLSLWRFPLRGSNLLIITVQGRIFCKTVSSTYIMYYFKVVSMISTVSKCFNK